MKRAVLSVVLLAAASVVLLAQGGSTRVISSGTLPTSCSNGAVYVKTGTSKGWYVCDSGSWVGPYPTVDTGGAPTDAQYWTGAADGTLSAEKNLGALSTGLVINTSGTPSAYAGDACGGGDFATAIDASGALTCGTPSGGGNVTTSETLTSGVTLVGNGTTDIKKSTLTATVVKSTSGTLSAATADTDYLTPTGLGVAQFVIASSTESVSNDTLQNDDVLAFSVGANEVYHLEMQLLFTTGTSLTPDMKYTFTVPSGTTITQSGTGYSTSATTSLDVAQFGRTQEAPPTLAFGVISTASQPSSPMRMTAVLRSGGSSGTVQLQWAQNTSTGGTPLVREADSYIKYTRVQ